MERRFFKTLILFQVFPMQTYLVGQVTQSRAVEEQSLFGDVGQAA